MAEADDARGMEPETREQSGDERQEGVETLNEGEDGECGGGDCEVYYAVGDYTAQDDSQVSDCCTNFTLHRFTGRTGTYPPPPQLLLTLALA